MSMSISISMSMNMSMSMSMSMSTKISVCITIAVPAGAIIAPLLNNADAPNKHRVTFLINAAAPESGVYVHGMFKCASAWRVRNPEFKGRVSTTIT